VRFHDASRNLAVRAVETLIHPATNLATAGGAARSCLERRARSIVVYDSTAKAYIEGMSGLWCTGTWLRATRNWSRRRRTNARLSLGICSAAEPRSGHSAWRKLKEIAPVPTSKRIFCNSGSEANEYQIKLRLVHEQIAGAARKKTASSAGFGTYNGVDHRVATSLTGFRGHNSADFAAMAGYCTNGLVRTLSFPETVRNEEEFATSRLRVSSRLNRRRAGHGGGLIAEQ